MPVDASIYNQLRPQFRPEGPLDQFGKAMSIRNLMGAGETQNLQQQLMREQIAGMPQQRAAAEEEAAAKRRSNLLAQDEKLVKLFQDQAKNELMQITTPEQWTAYRARQAERAAMLGSPEYQQAAMKALQADPEQFDPAYIQSKLAAQAPVPAGHQRMPGGGLSPVDPNYLAGRKAVAEAGAAKVTVPIDMKAQGKFAEEVGKKTADRIMGQHDSAEAAVENLHKLNLTLKQINDSAAITGPGAEIFTNLERAKQLVLADKKAGKRVSDTELLDALLGSDVFPMIKALGIGARGLDTPAEREFLRSVMTGVTPMNKETLRKMTQLRRDVAVRAIERWNKKVERGELDNYFKAANLPKEKIEIPALRDIPDAPAAPSVGASQFTEGQTATGPNGQKIIFKDGQWQPISQPVSR